MPILKTPPRERKRFPVHHEPSRPVFDASGVDPATATLPRLETHWTRVLYHDLSAPWRDAEARNDAPEPGSALLRADARREAFGPRTPVVAGVLLLGFYIALYLAVSAVIRIFDLEDAVMAQPAGGGADRPESASPYRSAMPPAPPVA